MSVAELLPGPDGGPLPAGTPVFRLALREWVEFKDFAETGAVHRIVFTLSPADLRRDPPRLTVYAEALTTTSEAWEFLDYGPKYGYSVHINVDDVRSARPLPSCPNPQPLDVVWERKRPPERKSSCHRAAARSPA